MITTAGPDAARNFGLEDQPSHASRYERAAEFLDVTRALWADPSQAGSSEDGRGFAARYAEAVFTAHQRLSDAQEFCADLKRRAALTGRDPAGVRILPGIVPIIGSTESEARELERRLDELIKPEYARIQLATTLRVSPADLPLDRELPADLPAEDEIEAPRADTP